LTQKSFKTGPVRDFQRMVRLLRRLQVSLSYFGLSVAILVVLAFLQAYSVNLLYLLVQGIILGNFGFVNGMPWLGKVASELPGAAENSASLFLLLMTWNYLVTLLRCAAAYFSSVAISFQAQAAAIRMRGVIFDRYLRFGKMFFDRNNVGNLSHLLMNSTQAISAQVVSFQQMLSQVITLLVYLALMCQVSWRLTLAVGAIFPLMNFFTARLTQRVRHNSLAHQQSVATLHRKIFNILTCIPLVMGYAKEEEEKRAFQVTSQQEVFSALAQAKAQHSLTPLIEICQTTALLLSAGALAIVGGQQHLEPPQILVFFFMANRAVPLFNALSTFSLGVAQLEGSLQAIEEILDDQDKFVIESGSTGLNRLPERLEFRNLTFSYDGQREVLRNVSFSHNGGQMLAIVGATGSGKTTLVNLLLRFYDCPPGSIFLDRLDIRQISLASLRQHVAFVSQDAFIFNDTLRSNLTYALTGPDLEDEVLMPVLRQARLLELVSSLPQGLDTVVGDLGVKLSGGEKQRVALARAMLKQAGILILDEATSSLDSLTENLIQEAMDDFLVGRTTIVIAHRLSTIRRAHKVVVLDGGVVVQQGSPQELLCYEGIFKQLWDSQCLRS
jgi:subfamily B ATP-binding cassette protein MsbA